MNQEVKKNLSFLLKFESVFLFLFLVLLGVSLPLQPTLAAWYDALIGAFVNIPALAVALVVYLLVFVTSLFSAFAGVILKWVISPGFISLSYTRPGFQTGPPNFENPIIATGLGITQGFANMILVLILIYIALATILRLAGYETKKLLVTFVLVALLVNFSPVICGLIVDASNIVMNYFLKELTGMQQLINNLKSIIDVAISGFNWRKPDINAAGGSIMYLITLAVFNFFLMIALLLFASIFLIRYIAIWILVILSPLAFISYILPATKKYWTLWWNQFLQWSFIGAIAGFFLYLGEQVATLAPSISSSSSELGGAILPHLVPLVFLYLGLIVGFATSAYGASAVMDVTKKYGIKGAASAGGFARRGADRIIGAGGKDWMEKQAAARFMPQKIAQMRGVKGLAAKTAYGLTTPITGSFWALRRGIGEAGLKLTEAGMKDIKQAEEKYKGTIAERKLAGMRDAIKTGQTQKASGVLRQAIEEGQIKDLKKLGFADPEITKIGKSALKTHPDAFKNIRDAFPHLAEEMGKGLPESIQKEANVHLQTAVNEGYTAGLKEKIMAEMKATKAPQMDSSVLFGPNKDQVIWESAEKHWQAGHWAKAGEAFGKKFCDEVRNEFLAHPQNFSPSAEKYFTSSPSGKSLYGI